MANIIDATLVVRGPHLDIETFATSKYRPHHESEDRDEPWPCRAPVRVESVSPTVIRYDWDYKYPDPDGWVADAAMAFPRLRWMLILIEQMSGLLWMCEIQGDELVREEVGDKRRMRPRSRMAWNAYLEYFSEMHAKWLTEAGVV